MAIDRSGHCLCGAVSFRASRVPDHLHACHCSMCRRHSGATGMTVVVGASDLVIEGQAHISTFTSSDWATRSFCARCGSGLWYRLTQPDADTADYYLSAGLLDDLSGMTLTQEIYIDEKPAAYAFAGDHQRLTAAEFEAMLAANSPDSTDEE